MRVKNVQAQATGKYLLLALHPDFTSGIVPAGQSLKFKLTGVAPKTKRITPRQTISMLMWTQLSRAVRCGQTAMANPARLGRLRSGMETSGGVTRR